MCKTKTTVTIIKEGSNVIGAKVSGICENCGKSHTIDIGDIQAALAIIRTFKMEQKSVSLNNDTRQRTYTYC